MLNTEDRKKIIEKYKYIPKLYIDEINSEEENKNLYEVACIGLIKAVNHYIESKDFEAYAEKIIKKEIREYLESKRGVR